MKALEGGRKLRYRGVDRNRLWMEMALVGYTLGADGRSRCGPPPEWTQPEPSALRRRP